MSLFERGPKSERDPEKESEAAVYVIVDCDRPRLVGVFDNFEEVRNSPDLLVGDSLFKISREDAEAVKKMEAEGKGEEIREYLKGKGYQYSNIPAQKDRR